MTVRAGETRTHGLVCGALTRSRACPSQLTDARYASYISHMQDDFLVEKGFMLGNINLPELAAGISPVLSHSCAVFTDVHEGYSQPHI